ncbi:AAA family ATPase [Ruminococcus sp. HUN007]|uniref:AAA family ATPase n=1 Tax=Ruminococcus sp. HUN007 TaxID=1514668 RepID=UPI0005D1C2D9|nr:AAA family ATPase [Ruminococcus sp. HUN007]
MGRCFNITGSCFPELHYMVDITDRLAEIKEMVRKGDYFIINRGRQYGKTTTLRALEGYLSDEYYVAGMDFQRQMSAAKFKDEYTFSSAFARAFITSFKRNNCSEQALNALETLKQSITPEYDLVELFNNISEFCGAIDKPVVLLIDEVDQPSTNQVFLDFLAQLRGYYLDRLYSDTFKSVILAGVYDIRNLKLKIRDESEHKHNSPWNIAVEFNVNMSLTVDGIAGMLDDYKKDHDVVMNTKFIAKLIYDYTSGYPVLVSGICKLIDEEIHEWNEQGIIKAVGKILNSNTPLFESLINKLEDYPEMRMSLYEILAKGKRISYSPDNEPTKLLLLFGFVKIEDGAVVIANRIFETRLYNDMLNSEEMKATPISKAGLFDKPEFVKNGILDMKLIFRRFTEHFHEIYGDNTEHFIEDDARKCFLVYLRPIINGIGNYYIEAQTRDGRRMDVVIDYLGKRYIIELKIWRGSKYNEDGEKQLSEYLDSYNLKKGYMLTFSFNKSKEPGIKTVQYEDKVLIEAVV